ncbi:MAG: hypothetical protein ABIT83_05705 [Massilia sp.]
MLQPTLTLVAAEPADTTSAGTPAADEIRAELQRVLASQRFAKSRRCSELLSFIAHTSLLGALHDSSEYRIGIEVFRRQAGSYHTGDDPIVRVQAGRLRARLGAYYADEGRRNPLRISIPLGGYLARAERVQAERTSALPRLSFCPLACLDPNPEAHAFTSGLNEELKFRLHTAFQLRMTDLFSDELGAGATQPRSGYLLEGAVRGDARRVRVSLRVRDLGMNAVVWSEQLDHLGDASISSQEQLADACHAFLRQQPWHT